MRDKVRSHRKPGVDDDFIMMPQSSNEIVKKLKKAGVHKQAEVEKNNNTIREIGRAYYHIPDSSVLRTVIQQLPRTEDIGFFNDSSGIPEKVIDEIIFFNENVAIPFGAIHRLEIMRNEEKSEFLMIAVFDGIHYFALIQWGDKLIPIFGEVS